MASSEEQNTNISFPEGLGVNINLSSVELYDRAMQGTYNDAVIKGFTGSKDEFDKCLSEIKDKLGRIGSYYNKGLSNLSNIDTSYENVLVHISGNNSLSISDANPFEGKETTVYVYFAGNSTITIPTTGGYLSMCGSSYTGTAGKWVEFNLKYSSNVWRIAKLEQE